MSFSDDGRLQHARGLTLALVRQSREVPSQLQAVGEASPPSGNPTRASMFSGYGHSQGELDARCKPDCQPSKP